MNNKKSDPPKLAIWLLRHARLGNDNDALIGDLIERFREEQTHRWLWKQVFIAFALGLLGEMRQRWPHFCYAIAGTAIAVFLGNAPEGLPRWLHWQTLPWPWSQLALELSRTTLLALAALPVLAAGLLIERSFRWVSVLRTAVINLALISFGHYSIDLFPWLLRPVPGNQNLKFLIIPGIVQMVLFFSTFLVAAWLGCLSPLPLPHSGHPQPTARKVP